MKGESEDSVSDVNYNRLKGKNLPSIHIACCIHMHIGLWYLVVSDEGVEEEEEDGEDSSRGYPYHTLVLDCAPIAFVDSTGIAALEQVVQQFLGKKLNMNTITKILTLFL